MDPCNMGGCHMSNPSDDDGLQSWHHSYTASELLSALLPPTAFSPLKVLIVYIVLCPNPHTVLITDQS